MGFSFEPPRAGLIWGFAFGGAQPERIASCEEAPAEGFRWLHLNLADQGSRHWIAECGELSPGVRELLLSAENHQHALIDGEVVGCVLHDLERDFDVFDTARVGALRMALAPRLVVTARHHSLRSADIVRERVERGLTIDGPAAALDVMVGAIAGVVAGLGREMSLAVQQAEDAFLDGLETPTARTLIGIRRRLAQLHRLTAGMRDVFIRIEEDEGLPPPLLGMVAKLSQRLAGLDGDLGGVQGQLRLLRDEIDIQSGQRTNQNLYVLSVMSALMLPATLITGIFGMNTGGMPFAGSNGGTLVAIMLTLGAAASTYLLLRAMGLMQR